MTRPARPNRALLASQEKIRMLQARIDEYRRLLDYLSAAVQVPGIAQPAQYRMMLEHQRDTAVTVGIWLQDHELYGPTGLMERIRASVAEPDYELEPLIGHAPEPIA